jgi:hypothetical protein
MLFKDGADHHGRRVLLSLVEQLLRHFEEVREQVGMYEFLDAPHVAALIVIPESFGDGPQTLDHFFDAGSLVKDLFRIARVRTSRWSYAFERRE